MLSVPWPVVEEALAEAGPLAVKTVLDTTNQFGPNGLEQLPEGTSAAQVNAERMPGARLVKSFNTLTAGFQAEAAERGQARARAESALLTAVRPSRQHAGRRLLVIGRSRDRMRPAPPGEPIADKLDGSVLTLIPVSDECVNRATVFESGKWKKTSA